MRLLNRNMKPKKIIVEGFLLLTLTGGLRLWGSLPADAAPAGAASTTMPTIQLKQTEAQFKAPVIPQPHPTLDWPTVSVKDDTEATMLRLQRAMKAVRLIEVWSIDPRVEVEKSVPDSARHHPFHGFHVIGREEIRNKVEIAELLHAIIISIAEAPEESADCFEPRHGLRIYEDKGFVDLLLCYSCENGQIFEAKEVGWFATGKSAEAKFDAVFKKLKLRKAD